ncbi:MAG TPA: hypothetical protein VK698_24020 [Kofleriaceae bacterium]|nr:hypothetical protein [Kofleriaceae bacterium]
MRVEVSHRAPRPGERKRLLEYTARSLLLQRRLKRALMIGVPAVVALAISPLDGTIVLICAAMLGTVVGVGFWITAGHIREWGQRLREMDLAVSAAEAAAQGDAPGGDQPGGDQPIQQT